VVPKCGVGHCRTTPKTMNTWPCFYINLHAVRELACSNDFTDKQRVLKLMGGGTGSPVYHLPGNVISATVGIVYIILQPEYELSSSTCFGQFRKFGKIGAGAPSSPACTPKETFCTGSVQVHVRGYLRVKFDLPSFINFRDHISGFPKLGAHDSY